VLNPIIVRIVVVLEFANLSLLMVFYFETGSVRGLAIDCEGCHGIETEKNGRLMDFICPEHPKKQSQL
jgi:hypothetical protein